MRDAGGNVAGIVEEKDCTEEQRAIGECNSGIYCFSAPALLGHLDQLDRNNAQGEYYLTDMLSLLAADGLTVASMSSRTTTNVSASTLARSLRSRAKSRNAA